MSAAESKSRAQARNQVSEVKYSLPDMLEELKVERAAAGFAMEKLDQLEIGKMFKTKSSRAKSKKQPVS
jgi:hypothetical protein